MPLCAVRSAQRVLEICRTPDATLYWPRRQRRPTQRAHSATPAAPVGHCVARASSIASSHAMCGSCAASVQELGIQWAPCARTDRRTRLVRPHRRRRRMRRANASEYDSLRSVKLVAAAPRRLTRCAHSHCFQRSRAAAQRRRMNRATGSARSISSTTCPHARILRRLVK